MNTVETSVQDSDLLWTNFEQLETGYSNSLKINLLAASAPLAEALTAGMYGPSAFGWLIVKASGISAIALYILFLTNIGLLQNHQFFKNRLVKVIGTGFALLITVVAVYYLKSFAILPIFQGMCHYSAYLQLEGLTEEKGNQLRMENLINQIECSNENVKEISYNWILSIKNLKNYLQFTLINISVIHEKISKLLELAYTHRKILTFNRATIVNSRIYPPIPMAYDQNAVLKQFEISVDYLIRCKQLHPDLDEPFVNTQLNHFADVYLPTCHLWLVNGIPVINQKGLELGDISQLKQKLIDCFGSATEIN